MIMVDSTSVDRELRSRATGPLELVVCQPTWPHRTNPELSCILGRHEETSFGRPAFGRDARGLRIEVRRWLMRLQERRGRGGHLRDDGQRARGRRYSSQAQRQGRWLLLRRMRDQVGRDDGRRARRKAGEVAGVALVERGNLTVWLSLDAIAKWNAEPSRRRGGQRSTLTWRSRRRLL